MPCRLVDRSGRKLKDDDVVKVMGERDILAIFFDNSGIIVPEDLDACLGKCGKLLETDASDSSAKLDISGIPKHYWFPVAGLESPDSAMTAQGILGNHLSESIPLELTEQLFQDDRFKDITFKLDDGEIRAHRNVLAASSCVFKAMLSGSMTEARSGEITISNVQGASVRTFLRLLYTGQVDPVDWKGSCAADLELARLAKQESCAVDSKPSNKVPVQILLELARLAKQYMIDGVIRLVVEAAKGRLAEAGDHDTETIQVVLAAAISEDLGAIRAAAIEAAKASRNMRELYEKRSLLPAVQVELQAIWPPAPRLIKRRRLE
eukprot:TRINITY_DN7752_c0_g1_i1.p1 TRINITY_DN7752_c0_g1~~TRINITY_DN7752_c0_g1_i1.p1  ORF type:complete len:321 (+),score=46.41 TRINITY_DN7752_c0_g1_i1:44-1006(+)